MFRTNSSLDDVSVKVRAVVYSCVSRLRHAREILTAWPRAMHLRSLLTMQHIAGDKASTIVFPLPIELAGALGLGRGNGASAG
jgi:hypothetical protein